MKELDKCTHCLVLLSISSHLSLSAVYFIYVSCLVRTNQYMFNHVVMHAFCFLVVILAMQSNAMLNGIVNTGFLQCCFRVYDSAFCSVLNGNWYSRLQNIYCIIGEKSWVFLFGGGEKSWVFLFWGGGGGLSDTFTREHDLYRLTYFHFTNFVYY